MYPLFTADHSMTEYPEKRGNHFKLEVEGQCLHHQQPNSGVELRIPTGVHCTIEGTIHTYNQDIMMVLNENECLVAPIVEVSCNFKHGMPRKCKSSSSHPFEIIIPHCVSLKNIKNIVVRSGNIGKDHSFDVLKAEDDYVVDATHITIFTSNFSQFICSECKEKCSTDISGFLFGSNFEENPPTQISTTRLYLCGPLYSIEDYLCVSNILLEDKKN